MKKFTSVRVVEDWQDDFDDDNYSDRSNSDDYNDDYNDGRPRSPSTLYHLSTKDLGPLVTFNPTNQPDGISPSISMAPSIEQCIVSLMDYLRNTSRVVNTLYVYTYVGTEDPVPANVSDSRLTDEYRVSSSQPSEKIGRAHV